jgi:hypothetical protein
VLRGPCRINGDDVNYVRSVIVTCFKNKIQVKVYRTHLNGAFGRKNFK